MIEFLPIRHILPAFWPDCEPEEDRVKSDTLLQSQSLVSVPFIRVGPSVYVLHSDNATCLYGDRG